MTKAKLTSEEIEKELGADLIKVAEGIACILAWEDNGKYDIQSYLEDWDISRLTLALELVHGVLEKLEQGEK